MIWAKPYEVIPKQDNGRQADKGTQQNDKLCLRI